MKNKLLAAVAFALIATLTSCTKNERARAFGGTSSVDLPAGTKLIGATWKENSLWYLVRPVREGEVPEIHTFQESSSYGMMEGKVIFKEK